MLIRALFAALLLSSLWLAHAQFAIPWHTLDGGGGTSTGGAFALTGGFWTLPQAIQTPGAPTLTIVPAGPGLATIAWTPDPGATWVLQQSPTLEPAVWTDAPSGGTNPVLVPVSQPAGFYRLIRP